MKSDKEIFLKKPSFYSPSYSNTCFTWHLIRVATSLGWGMELTTPGYSTRRISQLSQWIYNETEHCVKKKVGRLLAVCYPPSDRLLQFVSWLYLTISLRWLINMWKEEKSNGDKYYCTSYLKNIYWKLF